MAPFLFDFGVPDYPHPVLAFVKRLSRFKRTTEGPDVIHCNAGVGRSGTLVAIQAMIEMAKEEEVVDAHQLCAKSKVVGW